MQWKLEPQEKTTIFEGLYSSDKPGITTFMRRDLYSLLGGDNEQIPAPGRTGFPAGALLTAS